MSRGFHCLSFRLSRLSSAGRIMKGGANSETLKREENVSGSFAHTSSLL